MQGREGSAGSPGDRVPGDVVLRALAGEREAFETLVGAYERVAWNLARRIVGDRDLAADLVQEAFLKLHLHGRSFRAGERFDPWFFRILANLCLNAVRRSRLEGPVSDPDDLARAPGRDYADPERAAELRETTRRVAASFDRLPARYRAALALRVHGGLSVQETARALDCPAGTVKTLLHRARELLRRAIAKTGGESK